jgi:outer membrane lipoprotein SlyB
MILEHKNALGLFPDRQQTESALSQLKVVGFPTDGISVVVEQPSSEDSVLEDLAEESVQSEEYFSVHRAIDRFDHGALFSGALGTVGGGVLAAGLTSLSGGATLLIGMAVGAFYGAVSGGLIGSATGVGISDEQAKHYYDRLMEGYYLIAIKGTDDEIIQAELVLKNENIQDWIVFDTL